MSRPVDLTRREAELLVDLLEGHGEPEALDLGAHIRQRFGMTPREHTERPRTMEDQPCPRY